MSKIAFIGLGIMGAPMAGHLVAAGHTVVGYNRSSGPVEALVAAGGQGAGSVAEAVRRYAERYRQPRDNPARVAIRITITSVIGNV